MPGGWTYSEGCSSMSIQGAYNGQVCRILLHSDAYLLISCLKRVSEASLGIVKFLNA